MNRVKLTSLNQITFVAMMAVFSWLLLFVQQLYPLIGYWLTYLIPFMTLVVWISTSLKASIIFFITSLFLILIGTAAPFEVMIFYWLPGVLLGVGYAVCIHQKTSLFILVFGLSILQLGILYIIRSISLFWYEIDLLQFIYQLLNITNMEGINVLNPLLLYTIGLIQVVVSFVLLMPFIERWNIPIVYDIFFSKSMVYFFGALLLITSITAFLLPRIALYMIGPLALLSVYSYVYFFHQPMRHASYFLLFGLFLYPYVNAMMSDIFEGPFRILSILFLGFVPFGLGLYKSFAKTPKNDLR